MPGICGLISLNHQQDTGELLRLMTGVMMHEPFYVSGHYINKETGCYMGWVSREGSFSDCMPVMNEKKNVVLLFSGENFIDREVLTWLKGRNHPFDRTNASYLVHLYEEKGDDFLREMNGWFHGVLIDMRKGRVLLFNDRYGMQRLYYHQGDGELFFSSEAKSILRVKPELRALDMRSLGEMLSCNCVLEDRSLFTNIRLLPAASAWEISGNDIRKATYFTPVEWEDQPWLEKEYFYEELKHTVKRILPRYVQGNQVTGVSLTGGLDTRIIMANLDVPSGKIPCYTFSGMIRECSDVKVARAVADVCGQEHTTIRLNGDFLDEFPEYAGRSIYVSDGSLDLSGAVELYMNSRAREIAPVRLTGNHGSELLRGVRWLQCVHPMEDLFSKELSGAFCEAGRTASNIKEGNPLTFTLFKEAPWHEYNRLSVEQSQVTLRSPYMDRDLVELMYRAPLGARQSRDISMRLIKDGDPAMSAIRTDRGVALSKKTTKDLVARTWNEALFKAEYYFNYGMPQWLARINKVTGSRGLERSFLGRHKFYHFRVWYRDELAGYVREMLLDSGALSRPYVERKAVEHIVEAHTSGHRNYTREISQLLWAELVCRMLLDRI